MIPSKSADELTSHQKALLEKYSLTDIAEVLEYAAQLMFDRNTVDRHNFVLDEALLTLLETERNLRCSSLAVALFLSAYSPFWRCTFHRTRDKVHAYLLAASEARYQSLLQRSAPANHRAATTVCLS